MSLIHEALQKAETERRTGELPPLLSVQAAPKPVQRSALTTLAVAAGLALLTAAVYSNRDLLMQSAGLSEAAVDAATHPVSDAAIEQAPAPKAVSDETPPPAPATKPPKLRTPAADRDAGLSPEPKIADSGTVVPAPVVPVEKEPAPQQPIASQTQPPDPVVTIDAQPRPALTEPTPAPDLIVPPAPDVAATPPAEAIPYMFELPLATRQGLPALKVTMHVYSDDQARRFAIIDGKRVAEGGILGNELNVVEIRRDAILIDSRGTRFLLPRIGR